MDEAGVEDSREWCGPSIFEVIEDEARLPLEKFRSLRPRVVAHVAA